MTEDFVFVVIGVVIGVLLALFLLWWFAGFAYIRWNENRYGEEYPKQEHIPRWIWKFFAFRVRWLRERSTAGRGHFDGPGGLPPDGGDGGDGG